MTQREESDTELVLSGETADVGVEWVVSGRLRVRKQIVTDMQTIEVAVRREELVIDVDSIAVTSADGLTWAGTSHDGPPTAAPVARPPHVMVLREEVPEIRLVTRIRERVVTSSVLVTETVHVDVPVAREHAVLEMRDEPGIA